MTNCEQTQGLSVLGHGKLVHEYFKDLYKYLKDSEHEHDLEFEWRLPKWIEDNKEFLLDNLLDYNTLKMYQIYHDCGKPYCLTIDSEGKRHFPDHANASADTWEKFSDNKQISYLIRHDMDIHLLKADGVPEFSSRKEAISLLLTGLSELHANASMFGGISSTSFKIKAKVIDKRGKAIIKKLNNKL
jgi:hypothetical protein